MTLIGGKWTQLENPATGQLLNNAGDLSQSPQDTLESARNQRPQIMGAEEVLGQLITLPPPYLGD